jgi:hypothetical protein
MEPDFMGKEGFTWAVGVVENRFDPLFLGRCRVRWLGWHTKDKSDLPTSALPWAFPLMPITSASQTGVGFSPTGPVEGSWVLGFFRDGENASDPIMLGTLGGRPDKPCNPDEGFNDPRDYFPEYWQVDPATGTIQETPPGWFQDVPQHPIEVKIDPDKPSGLEIKIVERSDIPTISEGQQDETGAPTNLVKAEGPPMATAEQIPNFEYNYNYPLFRFLGEPTTPRLARGEEDLSTHLSTTLDTNADNELVAKQTGDTNSIIQIKENLRLQPVFRAKAVGDGPPTFREPQSPYKASYPYNHVHQSESGHVTEIDDTPGRERLHWYHRSGSYREMWPAGKVVDKTNEDYYSCVLRDSFEQVHGKKITTVKHGYELCVNELGGSEDYWLRVRGPGDVHLETEGGNVEVYCKDGIAFINARSIEFNAKNEMIFNAPLFYSSDFPQDEPSLHGGPQGPRAPDFVNVGTTIKRKGDMLTHITGAHAVTAGSMISSTMGGMGISAQSCVTNITHGSEEVIQGMHILTGSVIGKGITVQNGIINIRSADAKLGSGGILLQVNELPSTTAKGAERSAGGYLAIEPLGIRDPASSEVTLASKYAPVTMKNSFGEISIQGKTQGSVLVSTTGPGGEATLRTSLAQVGIDGQGIITIKNEVASLRKILDDFFTEYLQHSHDLVGATTGGSILPGGQALPFIPGKAGQMTVQSQMALNTLLSD